MKYIFVVFATLTLHGCGVGGMWMNGNPFYGREPYIPPRDYWVKKETLDSSQRSSDWIECGGDYQGGGKDSFPESEMPEFLARKNYYKNIQRCMLKKSYRYVGRCHDGNIDYPACGAP
jgi:hypothetical protein